MPLPQVASAMDVQLNVESVVHDTLSEIGENLIFDQFKQSMEIVFYLIDIYLA